MRFTMLYSLGGTVLLFRVLNLNTDKCSLFIWFFYYAIVEQVELKSLIWLVINVWCQKSFSCHTDNHFNVGLVLEYNLLAYTQLTQWLNWMPTKLNVLKGSPQIIILILIFRCIPSHSFISYGCYLADIRLK